VNPYVCYEIPTVRRNWGDKNSGKEKMRFSTEIAVYLGSMTLNDLESRDAKGQFSGGSPHILTDREQPANTANIMNKKLS